MRINSVTHREDRKILAVVCALAGKRVNGAFPANLVEEGRKLLLDRGGSAEARVALRRALSERGVGPFKKK